MTSLIDSRPGARARSDRRLLAVLVYAALMVAVVSTLGTPLIPDIAADQGVSLHAAQWMLTITLLVGAVTTPILGRLGDGPGRRRVLLVGLAAVCLGSLVAATADSFGQLLVGRALQGVGYGTVPLTIAIARRELSPLALRKAIATLSITVATGAGLGFPITGLIAQLLDYHAAFWAAAIVTAIAVLLVALVVPGPTARAARAARPRLDVAGAALLGLGLAALLLGISDGVSWGWGSPRIVALFAASVLLLAAWVAVELRSDHPLIDVRLVSRRAVLAANLAALLMGFGLYVALSLINRLAQTPETVAYGFGASLFVTGLLLVPLSIGSVVSSRIAAAMGRRFGLRTVLPIGATVVALTEVLLAVQRGDLVDLALATALMGIGVGCTFAAMPALIVASVPAQETGSATSLNQVMRAVGASLGSALAATILTAHTPAGQIYPDAQGYTVAFLVAAGVALVAVVMVVALLPAGVGRQLGDASVSDDELRELIGEETASVVGPIAVEGPHAFTPSAR